MKFKNKMFTICEYYHMNAVHTLKMSGDHFRLAVNVIWIPIVSSFFVILRSLNTTT